MICVEITLFHQSLTNNPTQKGSFEIAGLTHGAAHNRLAYQLLLQTNWCISDQLPQRQQKLTTKSLFGFPKMQTPWEN